MKRFATILLITILVGAMCPMTTYANEEKLELYAQSAVLMDADSGRILYSKEGDLAKANASTTKILTCILAIEYGNLDEIVIASKNAQIQPAVHLGVVEGETFVLRDMLYALMLESFNDSAIIIAETVSQSVESFAVLMNEKATEIGCKDSYFITPNGLDAEDQGGKHHTTASDLALIMRYCIFESEYKEEFLEITRTKSYSFTNAEGTRTFNCYNHNTLLETMDDALTGKTGFTNDAGYCYVGAIENEGRTFIIALLGCGWPYNRNYKWKDAEKLFEYGKSSYFYETIDSEQYLQNKSLSVPVLYAKTLEEQLYIEIEIDSSENVELLKRAEEEIVLEYNFPEVLVAPIEKNVIVGTVTYWIGDVVLKVDTIKTKCDVEKADNKWIIYKKLIDML